MHFEGRINRNRTLALGDYEVELFLTSAEFGVTRTQIPALHDLAPTRRQRLASQAEPLGKAAALTSGALTAAWCRLQAAGRDAINLRPGAQGIAAAFSVRTGRRPNMRPTRSRRSPAGDPEIT